MQTKCYSSTRRKELEEVDGESDVVKWGWNRMQSTKARRWLLGAVEK